MAHPDYLPQPYSPMLPLEANPDWNPFLLSSPGERSDPPRSISTREGVGDRLRAAAFAEIQAREAFNWAASRFEDAPPSLRQAWQGLALAEDRHLQWLLSRLSELGIDVRERKVSQHLWLSFMACASAQEFAVYMANAEERGRKAGERFHKALYPADPVTAKIFGKIAEEEVAHIALAAKYFPAQGLHCPPAVEPGSTPWPGGLTGSPFGPHLN